MAHYEKKLSVNDKIHRELFLVICIVVLSGKM